MEVRAVTAASAGIAPRSLMGSRLRSLVLFLPVAVAGPFLSACNSTPTTATTVSSVAVAGIVPFIGQTAQFTCTVTLSDSSTQDCTNKATWVSSNTTVLTVSSTGVVTALATGTSVIEASYQGVAGTMDLIVTGGVVVSSVAITAATVPTVGSSAQFTCTATFNDGSTQDVTKVASWVSFNEAVAKVSATGLVTGVAPGAAVIKATYGVGAAPSSGTFTFTVTQ
jgi:hypothetical protein